MKFIANQDKLIFFIGVGIIGFLFIFSYMILNHLYILIPVLILWIILSILIVVINYVEYTIQDKKIIIKSMRKKYEINFEEIEYIIQFSNYTNVMKEKNMNLS